MLQTGGPLPALLPAFGLGMVWCEGEGSGVSSLPAGSDTPVQLPLGHRPGRAGAFLTSVLCVQLHVESVQGAKLSKSCRLL